MPELTILVPAYDEEENLTKNLPLLADLAQRLDPEAEVLVVDDGSRDRTAAIAAAYGGPVRLIRHRKNLGPGAAIPTGLFSARGRYVMLVPADLAASPDDLARLYAARTDADVVVGLRSDRRDYTLFRKALSLAYIGLVRLLLGSRVRQFNYLQLYRRAIFQSLPIQSRGVFVTAEIIIRAERAGLRIREVPLRYLPRTAGRARGASGRAIARTALELGLFFLRPRRQATSHPDRLTDRRPEGDASKPEVNTPPPRE